MAAVVGAGPAGLLAATHISKQGYDVAVFEEHNRVGYPVHCAGMVSVEGFERLGIAPSPVFHQNTVYGGRVYSSDGSCITIKDRKPRAYIIDRGRFDSYLGEQAIDAGVDMRLGCRVDEILFKEEKVVGLKLSEESIESEIIIDAEGAKGRLLTRSGIETNQRGIYNGFTAELDVEGVESDMVEVWFDNSYAKDFFTWVIPISETRVRCGLGTSRKNGADALKKFIKKRFNHEPEDVHAGQLCTGGPVEKTAYPGILLVGDVAGQVKPTTAGGVVIGGLCAGIAGDLTVKALETGFVHGLSEYEGLWRSRYGSDLQTMLFLRNLLNTLSDERKDRIFNAFIEENLESKLVSLVETGDMDMQADVIKRAASDAAILGALVRSAGRVALSEFLSVFGF